jgi:hypothetical protein
VRAGVPTANATLAVTADVGQGALAHQRGCVDDEVRLEMNGRGTTRSRVV